MENTDYGIISYLNSNDYKQIGFYLALRHSEDTWVHEHVVRHCKGQYLISKEKASGVHHETAGEHFHICANMTDQDYHKLMKNVKDKYKLSGRAKDGIGKQYGKIKDIKNNIKLLAYCIKDGDYVTNIPPEQIEEIKKHSYKVDEEANKKVKKTKDWVETVANHIKETYPNKQWNLDDYRDMDWFEHIIFDHLGKNGKVFDKFIITRLCNGVYNLIPKTQIKQKEFQQDLMQQFREQFRGCYNL